MDAIPGPVYISGPMSGLAQLNEPAFRLAALALLRLGITSVVVPHDLTPPRLENEDDHDFYERCLDLDLDALSRCRTIALLPGWEASPGSRRELREALDLGLAVVVLGADGRPQ